MVMWQANIHGTRFFECQITRRDKQETTIISNISNMPLSNIHFWRRPLQHKPLLTIVTQLFTLHNLKNPIIQSPTVSPCLLHTTKYLCSFKAPPPLSKLLFYLILTDFMHRIVMWFFLDCFFMFLSGNSKLSHKSLNIL